MAEGKHRAEPVGRPGQWIPAVRPDPDPSDTRGRTAKDRRPGPKHERPEAVRGEPRPSKAVTRKTSSSSASSSRSSTTRKPSSSSAGKAMAASTAANAVAVHDQGGKPSVAGRTVSGTAAGAAAGAAVGSVVPVVGTAVGAGIGAAIGGVGGAVSGSRAKRDYERAERAAKGTAGPRKAIVAEFAVCMLIVALSPLTDAKRDEKPQRFMKRLTAVMALFLILGLLSAGGRGLAKAAAGFGGIVTVALAVSERDLFTKLAGIFSTDNSPDPVKSTGPPTGVDVGTMSGRARPLPGRRTGREA